MVDETVLFPEFMEEGAIKRRLATDYWLREFLTTREDDWAHSQLLAVNERISVLSGRLIGPQENASESDGEYHTREPGED